MAVDSAGNVYVAEYSNHRVQKFSSDGALLLAIGGGRGAGDGQFEFPSDVAVDAAGNVYVADNGNNRVQRFDPSGAFSAKWGTSGTGDGQFIGASGVALAAAGGVYVADFQNRRVQKFSVDGAFLESFGDASIFNRPIDVAERSGNLYVADYGGHRIHRFREASGGPPAGVGVGGEWGVVRGTVLVAVPAGSARSAGRVRVRRGSSSCR